MSFRKEKKYRLTKHEANSLKAQLSLGGMTSLHPPRQVNSLYFDTPDLLMFSDSEEGVLPRRKVRIRHYNDDDLRLLETKVSSLEGRFKKSSQILLGGPSQDKTVLHDPQYGMLYPSLAVTYSRGYYSYQGMRLTFDSNITYQNYRPAECLPTLDPEVVMEIKVSINFPDDLVDQLIPHPTARFSKYCRGILVTTDQF